MKSKKLLPPVYFNGSVVIMIILHFVFPVIDIIHFPFNLVGVIIILCGITLNIWTDRLFKNYATTVKPFEQSAALIVEGPFWFSRNPMYLGMVAMLSGLFIFLGSLSPFLMILIFFFLIHKKFIIPEGQALEKKFGKRFIDYKNRVRRWL